MSKIDTVEIKTTNHRTAPKKLKSYCLCCDKHLDVIIPITSHNAENYPCISGGVVFRSRGQSGSTILDSGVGIPRGWESEVQIIICDECLLKKADIVNTRKNKRTVIEVRPYKDVPVEWSDYSTFAELNIAISKGVKSSVKMFEKLKKSHEKRKIERAYKTVAEHEKTKAKK